MERRQHLPAQGSNGERPLAVVTGASSGFGMLTTLELARQGYLVVATMRDTANNRMLMQQAGDAELTGFIECMPLDVTDHGAIADTVNRIIDMYGQIDILVNNAGMAIGGCIEEIAMEDWEKQMDVNFFGMVAMTQAVLPFMRERRQGKVIQISSISGRLGLPGYGPYAASKFAVEGFSEALRLEMLPYGIHVVLVEPGAYKTSIWNKGFEYMEARVPAESPYSGFFNAILRYSKNTAEHADNPQEVARAVARIALSRYPRLRYTLGKGARAAIIGKSLLPWKWFERILLRELEK
ncbi:SDR family oxidoreductase [Paenibacillus sp. UNC451MF]|uniref:SDR family oxidoreductase n=1 Tax=Paenibacillus sp. UNC451MF TaxID=1449063 RepID=UPI0004916E51|nr:SDR family oxidoreductase [Paenibacillus sp. UNC451MF]